MEEEADWGMKRKEANNRQEEGRERSNRGRRQEDYFSINYHTMATRDSRRNSM